MAKTSVATFPLARLKFAAQLRGLAELLCSAATDAADLDAILVYVDEDGIINSTFLVDGHARRDVRMLGVVELVKAQLMEMVTSGPCETCEDADETIQ